MNFKIWSLIRGVGLSVLFILLGIYLIETGENKLEKILGVSNILFFGGILLWAVIKKFKDLLIKGVN